MIRFSRVRLFAIIILSIAQVSCAAAAGETFQNKEPNNQERLIDISRSQCCRVINLKDQYGVDKTLEDFKGKVVLVVFGYTNCPNVCPTTLYELSNGLSDKYYKENVALVFVTLDPARDDETMLRSYMAAFGSVSALRGTDDDVRKVANEFRVTYWDFPTDDPGDYTVEHTAGTYVLSKSGNPVWFVPFGGVNDPFWAAIENLVGE